MDLTIKVKASPGKFQELYQTLLALLPTMRKEKGCQDGHIYRDVEDGEVFFFSVHWEGMEDLEHYMRSSNGSALLGAIDLLGETVKVRVGNGTPWKEIDTLKRMRTKTI